MEWFMIRAQNTFNFLAIFLTLWAGGKVQQAAEAVDKSGEQMQQKAQQNQGKEQARKEV
jgi:hypothetical protein